MNDVARKLTVLQDQWDGCTQCELSELRPGKHIVFGAGPANADILLLSDAPTEGAANAGMPLVGELGEVFDEVLEASGIDPRRVFRLTLVGCRPYVVIPATEVEEEHIRDRTPRKEEIQACWPRVSEIIYLVDPRIIVAMGDTAWKTLVPTKDRARNMTTIAKAQDTLFSTTIPGRIRPVTYPVMAVLSPKQLVANPSAADHGPIATTAKALNRVARYVSWIKRNEMRDQ